MDRYKKIVTSLSMICFGLLHGQIVSPIPLINDAQTAYIGSNENELFTVQSKLISARTHRIYLASQDRRSRTNLGSFVVSSKGDQLNISDVERLGAYIYIAGNFVAANDYQNIIRLNTGTNTWDFPMQFSNPSTVYGLGALKSSLIITGSFRSCNKVLSNNICAFDGDSKVSSFSQGGIDGSNRPIQHIAINPAKDSIYLGGAFNSFRDEKVNGLVALSISDSKLISLKSDSFAITSLSMSKSSLFYSKYNPISKASEMYEYANAKHSQLLFEDSLLNFDALGVIQGRQYCMALIKDGTFKRRLFERSKDSFVRVFTSNPHFSSISKMAINSFGNLVSGYFSGIPNIRKSFAFGQLDFSKRELFVITYWDKNGNGKFNRSSDVPLPFFSLKYEGIRFFESANSSGLTHWIIPSSKKKITFEWANYKSLVPQTKSAEINLDTLNSNLLYLPIRFGISRFRDLKIRVLSNSGKFRSSDKGEGLSLVISNEGEETKTTDLLLAMDKRIEFIKSSLNPSSTTAGNLRWNDITVKSGEKEIIELAVKAPSSDIEVNEKLSFVASLSSTDDYAQNNVDSLSQRVENPSNFDNQKFQFSSINISGETISVNPNDGYIDYFIRFVNTTNDTMREVIVLDTIDAPLFVHAVQLTAHSHYMTHTSELIDNNSKLALRYTFPNLSLSPNPGKNSELNSSAGFINLRVYYYNTVPLNHSFINTANISQGGYPFERTNTVTAIVAANSTAKINTSSIVLFPNPVSKKLTIRSMQEDIKSIQVYSMSGQKLLDQTYSDKQIQLNIETLPSSSYLILVNTKSGMIKKLIIKE